jgi:hypothetical protein
MILNKLKSCVAASVARKRTLTAKGPVGTSAKPTSFAALPVTGNGDSHQMAEKLLRQF